MRLLRAVFLVFLCLACSSGAHAQAWDAGLTAALDGMAAKAWQPVLKTALGTFTYGYENLSTPFSRWLEDALGDAMARGQRIQLFNRAAAAAMDPAFKNLYGDFFEQNGVDALIAGTYFLEGGAVRVRLELTSLSDGLLLGSTELAIPVLAVPKGVAVEPTQMAADSKATLAKIIPARTGNPKLDALSVAVSTERGANAAYRDGEDLVIMVAASKEAWLKVYHVDVGGEVALIWPNRFTSGRKLAAGEVVLIPGPGDGFIFHLGPPFGTEFIKVVASTTPFLSTEGDFSSLGTDSRGAISRGLSVLSSDASAVPEMAEAISSYVIMPGR